MAFRTLQTVSICCITGPKYTGNNGLLSTRNLVFLIGIAQIPT